MDEKTQNYLAVHTLHGVVRIPEEEYGGFLEGGFLAHFNLERTTVAVGKRYALPRIFVHGRVASGDIPEVFPVLSFDDIYHAECLEVRNNIPYEALTEADFKYSFTHIQNVDDLKRYILLRYRQTKPHLNDADLLSLGVSRMLLCVSKL